MQRPVCLRQLKYRCSINWVMTIIATEFGDHAENIRNAHNNVVAEVFSGL